MSLRAKVVIALVAVCLIFGTSWMAIKVSLESVPPMASAAMRFVLGTLTLAIILRFRLDRFPRERLFWALGLMLGFVAFSIPFALTYWGQMQIPSGLASVLFATFPFWVALLSHLYLPDERMNAWKLIGMVAGFVGIVVIFAGDFSFDDSFTLWGMGAIIASAFVQAISIVIMRKHAGPFDTRALVMVGMGVGAVSLGLFSLLVEDLSSIRFTTEAVLSIVYLGTFASVVTFVTYFWLLKHLEAVFLSLTAFVTPILAVLTGALVLDEAVTADLLLGAVLVLAGILASNGSELLQLMRKRHGVIR